MICPNCKNQNFDGATSCQFCGTVFNAGSVTPAQPIENTQPVAPAPITQEVEKPKKKKGLKVALIIFILLLIAGGIGFAIYWFVFRPTSVGVSDDADYLSIVRDEVGNAKFIDGAFTNKKIYNESDAFEALAVLKDELKFKNISDEFYVESTEQSEGMTYYKFHQKYNGTDVYGTNLVIAVDKNNNVSSMSGYYIPDISIDVNEKKTKDDAENVVKTDLGENSQILKSDKYIIADNQSSSLAYVVLAISSDGITEYMIDANSNEVLNKTNVVDLVDDSDVTITDLVENIYDANYEYGGAIIERYPTLDLSDDGRAYRMNDLGRKIYIVDGSGYGADPLMLLSAFNNIDPEPIVLRQGNDGELTYLGGYGKGPEIASMGFDALRSFESIYDYYKNVLGRDSYDGKGGKIIVNVGLKDSSFSFKKDNKFQNAAWFPITNQMYIGYLGDTPFTKAKDVLAHEFTHGVISKTAGFAHAPKKADRNKAFETGALSEGIADILGSLIEGRDWRINDSIQVLRSLDFPESYYPSKKDDNRYYPNYLLKDGQTIEQYLMIKNYNTLADDEDNYDGGGVHHNALVPGHAAYLMYKNGAFSSMEEEARVWYNALFLLSSYSNFEDCALAVIKSAQNLGLSDKSVQIIEDAFMETNMLEDKRVALTIKSNVSDFYAKLEAQNEGNMDYEFRSSGSEEIRAGTYILTMTKEGYKDYKRTVTIHGDTTLRINLESLSDAPKKEPEQKRELTCDSGNCHTLTIYYLDAVNGSNLNEESKTYIVDDGTVLGSDLLVKTVNDTFGSDLIETDGETFYISVGELTFNFAWYYKGTDKKFNFNEPITDDVEIEMKMLDGAVDDDFIEDMDDFVDDVEDFFDFLKDL